jgi:hypothetical protein
MIRREAKDKWRAYVMPHEPMYHHLHLNQPAMLVSVSFSLQLQSVRTTPMLPNKPSPTPLRFMSLSLFPSFFPLFISSSRPTPSKKRHQFWMSNAVMSEKWDKLCYVFIFCIWFFTLIKIKVHLKNSYMLYVRAVPSKMVTTTFNEVYFDVKLTRMRASAPVYV